MNPEAWMVMLVMTPLLLAASWADGGLSLDEVDDIVALHAPEMARVSDGATGPGQTERDEIDGREP